MHCQDLRSWFARCWLACAGLAFATGVVAEPLDTLARRIVGGDRSYVVQPGDFLIAIGARFGVSAEFLAKHNGIAYDAILRPGQTLRIHNPHIVPARVDDGILINIPQRMLFHVHGGALVAAYPVGLGRSDWPTPVGRFRIVSRETNKTWKVPKSIQEEMRRERKMVVDEVPPGPDNPLGRYWLGLSAAGYGIHGTIAPASVYHFQSHGCIRLHPDDIAELFGRVRVGTPVRIIYQPALLARLDDGRILLEAHRDVYGQGGDALRFVSDVAAANGLGEAIDWTAAGNVIARARGLAEAVGEVRAAQSTTVH